MEAVHQKEVSLTARTIWFMGARTLAFIFSFGLPLLLVRRLSQHEFGVYKQLFLVVGTAVITLPLGFGMSAYYFLPREPEHHSQIAFNVLLFHAAVGSLVASAFLLFPGLLISLFHNVELAEYASLVGVLSFVWIVSAPLDTLAIANQEAKLAGVFIVGSQVVKASLLFFAAFVIGSLRALLYAAVVHGVLQIGVLLWYLGSRFGAFWKTFSWSIMGRQLAYALPLGLAAFLFRAHADLHHYFVSYNFTATAYAIYAVGCFNVLIPGLVTEAVGTVLIPRVSYLQSRNQHIEIINLLARMLRKVAALFLPLYFLLLVIGREFISVLFTDLYLPSWPIFAINLTFIPLALIPTAYDPVTRAYPEYRFFLIKVRAVLLVVLLAALVLFTRQFGLVGAITAVVMVAALENVITATRSAKILGVTRRDFLLLKDVLRIAAAAIIAGTVSWLVLQLLAGSSQLIKLTFSVLSFAVVYLTAILLLRIITPQEWDLLKAQVNRASMPWRRSSLLVRAQKKGSY